MALIMKEAVKPRPRIKELRIKADLTQLELAQCLGVTETTIANWEAGRSGIDWIERVIKLCRILDCRPDNLLEYVHSEKAVSAEADDKSISDLRSLLDTAKKPSSVKNKNGRKG